MQHNCHLALRLCAHVQEDKLETIQLKLEAALGLHQQLNESIAQMQAEMKAICTKHEADVAALTAEHDDIEVMLHEELTDMECRHQNGLKALQAAHRQQLTDLQSSHRQVDHVQGENENLEAVVVSCCYCLHVRVHVGAPG